MPTHHIQLTNTSGANYDLYPTTSPLTLTLAAQSLGTHFVYGTAFTNITDVLLELADNQPPVLLLTWPSGSNPQWTLRRTSGSTSYTSTTVGNATSFTFDVPAPGSYSTFELDSTGSDTHALGVAVRR